MINFEQVKLNDNLVANYCEGLFKRIYKILPMWDERQQGVENYLETYIESLQIEIVNSQSVINKFNNDANFITIISILEFLLKSPKDCDIKIVKREVFKATSICKKMVEKYKVG